jgi:hypothetical protein
MLYNLIVDGCDSGGMRDTKYHILIEADNTDQVEEVFKIMKKKNGGFWYDEHRIIPVEAVNAELYIKNWR